MEDIKQEVGEELEKPELQNIYNKDELENAYKPDVNINYRELLFNTYKNKELEDFKGIDDYIDDIDKINLLKYCSKIVKTNYPQYPSPMDDILVKHMYYNTIKDMNKDEYLKEKDDMTKLSIIDRELKKIKDESDLSIFINDKNK